MKIKDLRLRNFMIHDELDVNLEAPITLITGRNGCGKSALVEGIAWCLWGNTLRGSNPCPPAGGKTEVTVTLDDGMAITRSVVNTKRLSLTWTGESYKKFETATKAQAALVRDNIGEFSSWKASSVFWPGDTTATFASGTDKSRKELLEGILRLDLFDSAMASVKETLKTESLKLNSAAVQVSALEKTITQIQEITKTLPEEINDSNFAAEQKKWEAQNKKVMAESQQAQNSALKLQMELDAARRSVKYMTDSGTCITCGSAIAPDIVEKGRQAVVTAHERWCAEQEKASAIVADCKQKLKTISAQLDAISQKIGQAKMNEKTRKAAETAKTQLDDALAELDISTQTMVAAGEVVEVCKLATYVLGWQGARALLLDGFILALKDRTNAFLEVMQAKMRIDLTSTSDTDRAIIQYKVDGVGAGSFQGASTGERRRLDVATLLALATLQPVKRTLFFDETFDGLDDDGIEGLCSALRYLTSDEGAGHRAVVITHRDSVIDLLPKAAWVKIG